MTFKLSSAGNLSILLYPLVFFQAVLGSLVLGITFFSPGMGKVAPIPTKITQIAAKDSLSQSPLSQPILSSPPAVQEAPKQNFSITNPISHRVKAGDTFMSIWKSYNAPVAGALLAAKACVIAGLSCESLRLDEEIIIILSSENNDVIELKREFSDGSGLVLKGNSSKGYTAEILSPKLVENTRFISGTIFSSFSVAASDLAVPHDLIDEFVDLFSNRVEFRRDLQPGDTFTLSFKEKKCERSGVILPPSGIMTASLYHRSNLLAAVRHIGKDSRSVYFDETGKPLGNGFLRYPLQFTRISSTFSWGRFHPVLRYNRPHLGVDFAAPIGTPVRSIADGSVILAGYKGDAGIMVRIQHTQGYTSEYMHLSKLAQGVKSGDRITRGQLIGTVGMTGLTTGSHLHFGLFKGGAYVDPLRTKLPDYTLDQNLIPPRYLLTTLSAMRKEHEKLILASNEAALKHL